MVRNLSLKQLEKSQILTKVMDNIGFFYVKTADNKWLSDTLKIHDNRDISVRKVRLANGF